MEVFQFVLQLLFGVVVLVIAVAIIIGIPALFLAVVIQPGAKHVDIDEPDGTSYVTLPNGDRRLDDTEGGYGQ